MALRQVFYGSPEHQAMLEMRYAILRKPWGLEFTEEELERDKTDVLIGCFDDDKLEGCCQLSPLNKTTIRLRQMAVLSGLQGKGIGSVLMRFAENLARDKGFRTMTMHARENAVGFYSKLGYKIASDIFTEVGMPHYVMEKKL